MAQKRFNVDALTKVFKKIVQNYATEDELKKVDARIDGIISEGGEPNIIDTVQQNGKDLEVVDKTVNVIVPTKVSELENDEGYATDEGIDEKIAGKVDSDGGELADTIVTYDEESTTVESFPDFISNFVSGTRVAKWFRDFRAGVEYILHVGSLVNNCVTDNADLPLSAAQGKVLMDELTQVKSDLTEVDISNYISSELSDFTIFKASYVSKWVYIQVRAQPTQNGQNLFNISSPYIPSAAAQGFMTLTSSSRNADMNKYQAIWINNRGECYIYTSEAFEGIEAFTFIYPVG